MDKRIVNRNGMEVWCYGRMDMEQNTHCVLTDANGEAFDMILARGFRSWPVAVEYVTGKAKANGHTVEEMSGV